jgi:hypothetical protein
VPQARIRGGGGVLRPEATRRLTCGVVVVELRGFEPLTPCMPCSFGPLRSPRSGASGPLSDPLRVTVVVRWLPLVTAAYGTWVARPMRMTIVDMRRRRLRARLEVEIRPR